MTAVLSRTTRMPNGVTNAAPRQTMGNAGFPDPTWAAKIALDYIHNGDLTALSETGSAVVASAAGVGGNATITTGAAANVPGLASTAQAAFQLPAAGNTLGRMFFKWAGALDSLVGTLLVGFIGSTIASPQGVYIQSAVTTGALSLVVKNGTGTTTVPFPANLALVAATQVELGIEIDGQGNCFAYFNPTTGEAPQNTDGSIANGPVAAAYNQLNGALTGLTLPTGALLAAQGAIPTTAVARVLTVDYFVAAQQRAAI